MGLTDFASKIVTTYKADTSDHKAKIRELRGEEKKLEQERLKATESHNKGLDDQIKMWGKVGLAIGATVATFKLAQAATKAYLDDTMARAAAAGTNIDKLKDATKGLASEQKLLQFAGGAMHGTWKLNQEQMQMVLQGAMALRKQFGTELEPTIDKLMMAIRKGTAEELKEFGISAKTQSEFFAQLEGKIKDVGGATDIAGDSMRRASVSWKDSVNQLMVAIGELVASLAPLIEALAKAVDLAARGARGFRWVMGGMSSRDVVDDIRADYAKRREAEAAQEKVKEELRKVENLSRMRQAMGDLGAVQAIRAGQLSGGLPDDALARIRSTSFDPKVIEAANQDLGRGVNKMFGAGIEAVQGAFGQVAGKLKNKGKGRKEFDEGGAGIPTVFEDMFDQAASSARSAVGGGTAVAGAFGQAWQDARGTSMTLGQEDTTNLEEFRALMEQSRRDVAEWQAEMASAQIEQNKTILETLFGTPADISLTATALQQVGSAFNIVTSAAGAAFDAWITGSKSLGDAFKEAIAEGLRGLAVQASVEALKHTAFGFGALAFGPIMGATAAQHFHAAALFGGVAIAAGAGAHFLGKATGQWSQSSSSGSGASAGASPVVGGGGSRSNEPGETSVNIMLGQDFLALPDLEQRELMHRAITIGTRKGGTKNIRHE